MDGIGLGLFAFGTLCCIGADGFCVLFETAIKESSKSRLERMADDGESRAVQALSIVEEPENLLSMVQIGIPKCLNILFFFLFLEFTFVYF